MLPGAPKLGAELIFMFSLGAELIFMFSLGRHPDWDSIVIRSFPNSSSNMLKTGKTQKEL